MVVSSAASIDGWTRGDVRRSSPRTRRRVGAVTAALPPPPPPPPVPGVARNTRCTGGALERARGGGTLARRAGSAADATTTSAADMCATTAVVPPIRRAAARPGIRGDGAAVPRASVMVASDRLWFVDLDGVALHADRVLQPATRSRKRIRDRNRDVLVVVGCHNRRNAG
jgi:hypothetical protein